MALTPKETARLAAIERVIPVVQPFFTDMLERIETFGVQQEGAANLLLALLVGTLKDEYANLKARQ